MAAGRPHLVPAHQPGAAPAARAAAAGARRAADLCPRLGADLRRCLIMYQVNQPNPPLPRKPFRNTGETT